MPLNHHTTLSEARQPLTASLVLFVGARLRPDAGLEALLAHDGVRCWWLAGIDQATQAAQLAVFDAAVLDATLADSVASPGLPQLRALLGCPLMLVASQADEVDEIVALELGADTYVALPLAPRRLRAHLRALLRGRRNAQAGAAAPVGPSQARFDGWALERASGVLSGHGRRIELTPVQARLLQGLMDAAGLPVPRPALMAALPRSAGLAARSVDVYISRLRQRLELEGVQRLRVHMVRGCGYALQGLANIRPTQAPAEQATPAQALAA